MNVNKKVLGFVVAIVAFVAVMLVPMGGLGYFGFKTLLRFRTMVAIFRVR